MNIVRASALTVSSATGYQKHLAELRAHEIDKSAKSSASSLANVLGKSVTSDAGAQHRCALPHGECVDRYLSLEMIYFDYDASPGVSLTRAGP